MRDGTLTGKFSYIIMEKGDRPRDSIAEPRILAVLFDKYNFFINNTNLQNF